MGCDRVLEREHIPGGPHADAQHVHLPPVPRAAVDARRFVRRLDLPVSDETVASAELMVTELVTNVVLHARTHAVVGVAVTPETVLVTVQDEDAAPAEQQPYGVSLAQQGRGLQIVETLSQQWGVSAYNGGKVVWFTVPRTSPAAADSEGERP